MIWDEWEIDENGLWKANQLVPNKDGKLEKKDKEAIKKMLEEIKIDMKKIDGVDKFYLNGEDVSGLIREKEVNEIVTILAKYALQNEVSMSLHNVSMQQHHL